ncbi:MAG: efflux RND transporter periplasmic adaptor subunit [Gemmatimonadota bacterium]|nr:efflux RND transporter periplasmic adaptor subunit [Gemmatimonadota bacterium]
MTMSTRLPSPHHRAPRRALGLTGLVAGAVLAAGCGATGESPAAEATAEATAVARVDTATLSAQSVAIGGFTFDTARLVPWRSVVSVPARLMLDPGTLATIGSITEGRITHVLVRVGDRVQAGQVLVLIHSHEIMDARGAFASAIARVAAAEAERDLAVSSAARAGRLLEAKAMSRAEVERAEVARRVALAGYQQAVAERDRAAAMIEHLVGTGGVPSLADEHDVLIRTPIAGVVTGRDAQPGTVVLPGTPLVSVGDPDRLQLQMHVSAEAAAGIQPGADVRFALTETPAAVMVATVTRVAPTVDTLTRTIEVIATPARGVRSGRAESFAQAEIAGRAGAATLTVPSAAVQAFEGDTVVIVADQRGEGIHIEAVRVRVGRRAGNRTEILSGVSPGRRVIAGSAAIAKAELLKRRSPDGE